MNDPTQEIWSQLTGGAVLPPKPTDEPEPKPHTDHAAEAERLMGMSRVANAADGAWGTAIAAEITAHATLALVEQTRRVADALEQMLSGGGSNVFAVEVVNAKDFD